MKSFFFTFSVILLTLPLFGQPDQWSPVPGSDSLNVYREMDYSENLDLTVYTSGMYYNGNRVLAGFDGEDWIPLTDSITGWPLTFEDWGDGIVLGGTASQINGQQMPYAAYYNGESWSFPWEFDGSVQKFKTINDTLFALGFFTHIDGQEAFKIAKLVGDEWVGMLDPHPGLEGPGLFTDIAFFDGNYYVGGNFNPDGLPWNFAKVVDGQLESVGQGITGAWAGLNNIEVYQGDLYLSGSIPMQDGNLGNHMLRWDGEFYHNLGPILYTDTGAMQGAGIISMKPDNGYLYFAGNFFFFDDVPIYGVARWDGSEWCELYTQEFVQDTEFYQPVWGIGFFENQLFMLKPFFYDEETLDFDGLWTYDTSQDPNFCIQPLHTSEPGNETKIQVFPNPSTGNITLESESPLKRISAFDAMGRLVFRESIQNKNNHQLNLNHLPKGLYLLQISGGGFEKTEKVVLE